MNQLTKEYKELITEIQTNKINFKEEWVSVFNIAVGNNFQKDYVFYGRAVNGWKNYSKHELSSNFNAIEDNIKESDLKWVIDLFNNPDDNWKPSRSAFWRLIKRITSEKYDDNNYEVLNNIAWSNLYKISKADEGNPSQKLINAQSDRVKKILKMELDLYQPKTAIFLTSLNWANPFLTYLEVEKMIPIKPNKYVEFVGKYNNTIIVVGQHPQGKPEEEHKNEIVESIKYAEKHFN
jgi:hypothetical protein